MKAVVLCSGGMDSVAALYQAGRDHEVIAVLSFHYDSKHNDREIPFAAFWSRFVRLVGATLGGVIAVFIFDAIKSSPRTGMVQFAAE